MLRTRNEAPQKAGRELLRNQNIQAAPEYLRRPFIEHGYQSGIVQGLLVTGIAGCKYH